MKGLKIKFLSIVVVLLFSVKTSAQSSYINQYKTLASDFLRNLGSLPQSYFLLLM